MDRREEIEQIVIPPKPIRQLAAELASALRNAIARAETAMGCRFSPGSRFHQALAVLDGLVSSDGSLAAASKPGILTAVQLARDVTEIVAAMPATRVADFRKDMETCARGPLEPLPTDYQPVQAQSQLLVRAAFHLAGANPTQPTHSGSGGRKKPDILLKNGLATYGIEVKRPSLSKNAVPRALDAAEQLLNAGLSGGIVLDVTDGVRHLGPEEIGNEVVNLAHTISAEFFIDGVGWRSEYSHVLMVAAMARPAWQLTLKGQNEGQVQVHSVSCAVALGTARGTLDTIRSHWMRQRLNAGLNALNASPTPSQRSASGPT